MSFKEVKELRKSGKLEEALKLGLQDLEVDPSDIWNKRSVAWVYYEFLKKNNSRNDADELIVYLNHIKDLNLPSGEEMLFDNSAWQIIKILFDFSKAERIEWSKVQQIFESIKDFQFSKPSEAYTILFKAFHKCYKDNSDYIKIADWWDFENFRKEDFLKEILENGKLVISIAEQAYTSYSKHILEGKKVVDESNQWFLDIRYEKYENEVIENWLERLELMIEKHPDYQYLPYYKAKLLLNKGDIETGLSAFLPFAKQKKNDFWVWEIFADIYKEDPEKYLSCLCKALTCKASPEFLVKIREKIASIFIEKEQFIEACIEIEEIISQRTKQGWKIPNKITDWTKSEWFSEQEKKATNNNFYLQHSAIAEELLFHDIPEETAVVEFVNHDKKILNFIISKNKHGFLKYDSFLKSARIGDVLSVRLEGIGQNLMYKVMTLKKSETEPDESIYKKFKGILRKRDDKSFGFVDDMFVQPDLIEKNNLENGQELSGEAILSFNKKKEEWGWKVISIT